ncbi:MAG: enolase C-terminal domain-like protein [Pigmentiphaga sp.]|uniref:enolase C-terminal domain-like protein n=1 Tax=Pigmentiphaga sp. TaxID=1977564 RepID=UPI0029ABC000|nr:enolase C-terminal domain-like protein [Pigmentiphaga sp.]MDX3905921.1 enolase C-terminal domain-like protein [Pigmentiphaga sp.]
MKIQSVEICKLELPPRTPSTPPRRSSYNQTAKRAFPINKYAEFPRQLRKIPGEVADEAWIKVTAEDGTWGVGLCHWGSLIEPLVRRHFSPLLTGRDCLAIEYLNDLMWRSCQRFGATGLASVARSGIDLALWDLKGKLLDVPVYSLIGGPCREQIDCYCTSDDLDWTMELGFKAFKISNPVHYEESTEGINRLEEKVAKARETVGPDADLMLNPVMSFNVEFAARLMERLLPYRLRWIEEPLMPHDVDGLAQLKQAVPTLPIATGEDHKGRHAFRELVDRRCVDVLQPDLRWFGGLTEALKVYTLAEAAGLSTFPHSGASLPFGQHFHFAMPEAQLAEYWLGADVGVPLAEAMRLPGVQVPVNGKVRPSDAPGFGIDLKQEWLVPWP